VGVQLLAPQDVRGLQVRCCSTAWLCSTVRCTGQYSCASCCTVHVLAAWAAAQWGCWHVAGPLVAACLLTAVLTLLVRCLCCAAGWLPVRAASGAWPWTAMPSTLAVSARATCCGRPAHLHLLRHSLRTQPPPLKPLYFLDPPCCFVRADVCVRVCACAPQARAACRGTRTTSPCPASSTTVTSP
jgi:hypothetical protein